MRRIFYCLVVAMFLAACGKLDLPSAPIEEEVNPYAVTPDEAVQLLQTVIGGESTRAISVGEIKTLRKSDFVPTTRGDEDGDAIYIVDLENGGSAIMGADKRMEPIYAILDETKISPEQLMLTATRSDSDEEDIEDFILGALNNAIQMDSRALIPTFPEFPRIPRPVYWTETNVIAQKAPLLRTKWHQSIPYNNNCDPNPSGGGNYPAGCVAIATAQVMYYNRLPNAINGVVFDWSLISQFEFDYEPFPSESAQIEVANFIFQVAEGVNTNYGSSSTSSIYYARNLLQSSGYSNATVSNYSLSSIRNMITNNLPVFIDGRPSATSNVGHTWVIDGCNIYNIEHWVREYQTELLYNEYIERTEYNELLHCNFGWGGNCDGYYTSWVFDPTNMRDDDEYEPDYGDVQAVAENDYSSSLLILTYSLN